MLDYLRLAIASYSDNAEKEIEALKAYKAKFYNVSEAQFYVVQADDELIIVLRGSSSLSDFVTDIKIKRVKLPNDQGLVHSGFFEQYKTIEQTLNSIIKSTTKEQITFVGHSLGGALATLGAFFAHINYPSKKISCVTFGSPRVGNKHFVDLFDKAIDSVRVVNGHDIVTTRPYWGYAHVKGLLQIGTLSVWKYFGSVEDHYTQNYEKSIHH